MSISFSTGAASFVPAFWNSKAEETCNHLDSREGIEVFCEMRERVEGLVEGIRIVAGTTRRALDIEAGPLLQAENMISDLFNEQIEPRMYQRTVQL